MARYEIRHETRYAYERPVRFGPQRLLVRPRDSHAVRVWDARLTLSPPGETRWFYDAMGNSVCAYTPQGECTTLTVVSELAMERFPAPLDIKVADPQTATPIVYAPADRAVLAPFLTPVTPDLDGRLLAWVRDHAGGPHEPALEFLLRLNRAINAEFAYKARDEGAAHSPGQTARLGYGSCRDLAWLMVEALRILGYAARFVTGYIYCRGNEAIRGAGATHAWCEVFLPSLGWTEFDPTNALAESADLLPVAVARTPAEAAPVSGKILSDPGGSEMTVHVDVRPAQSLPAAA
jgi:transglutaminase-like putative cysteine protease